MISWKHQSWSPAAARPPRAPTARRLAALALRRSSVALAKLARRLAAAPARHDQSLPELEFYAEAGAPEGAPYLNGRLVGLLPGITRL